MQICSGIKLLKTTWKDNFGSDALFCLPEGSCRRALDCSDAPSFSVHRGTHSRISPVQTAVCSPDRCAYLCKLTYRYREQRVSMGTSAVPCFRHSAYTQGPFSEWKRFPSHTGENALSLVWRSCECLECPQPLQTMNSFTIHHFTQKQGEKRRAQRKHRVLNELKGTFFSPPCA